MKRVFIFLTILSAMISSISFSADPKKITDMPEKQPPQIELEIHNLCIKLWSKHNKYKYSEKRICDCILKKHKKFQQEKLEAKETYYKNHLEEVLKLYKKLDANESLDSMNKEDAPNVMDIEIDFAEECIPA